MSFNLFLDWILDCSYDEVYNSYLFDDDLIINNDTLFPDPYITRRHTLAYKNFLLGLLQHGGEYISFEFSDGTTFNCLEVNDSYKSRLLYEYSQVWVKPPVIPVSLEKFPEYKFFKAGYFDNDNTLLNSLDVYQQSYRFNSCTLYRKLLKSRYYDILNRVSFSDKIVLQIVILHLPKLDIDYK